MSKRSSENVTNEVECTLPPTIRTSRSSKKPVRFGDFADSENFTYSSVHSSSPDIIRYRVNSDDEESIQETVYSNPNDVYNPDDSDDDKTYNDDDDDDDDNKVEETIRISTSSSITNVSENNKRESVNSNLTVTASINR